jgi:hypothetical protein
MSQYRIPFNRPALVGAELEHVRLAIEGGHSSGDGPYTKRCENRKNKLRFPHRRY